MPMAGAGGDLTTTVATAPTGTILVTAIGVIIITTTATTTINDDNGSGAGAYVLRSSLADYTQSLRASAGCPLYPRKQTYAVHNGMSALGQKRTYAEPMSALGQKRTSIIFHMPG